MKKIIGDFPFQKLWTGMVCLLMSLGLVFAAGDNGSPAVTAEADTKEGLAAMAISAYVYDRADLVFRDEDAFFLTQIIYSFALIKDGKVSGSHWHSIDAFKEFMKKHPGIQPILAVGGWGADGFSQAAANKSSRKVFTDSAVELMQENGFLGIDIDWEYPGSSVAGIESSKEDSGNLLLLMKEIRAAFDILTAQDGKKRTISIAVGGSRQYADMLHCEAVGQLTDQVNVMTYDLRGFEKVTGHHTSLYSEAGDEDAVSAAAAIDAFIKAGIPEKKLMMGAAFYGRAWRSVKSKENNGLGQKAGTSGNKSYGYDAIQRLIKDGTYIRHWDERAMAPYLFNGKTFISYEDDQSITAKGIYAKDNGLMGVMFWEYGLDKTGKLLKALYTSLNGMEVALKSLDK